MNRNYKILHLRVNAQQGVSLTIVLILLLIMTLLGIASMRGALMQERMAANQFDRSLGFQAAEAALRDAEARLLPNPPAFPSIAACNDGLCAKPVAGTTDRWIQSPAWRTVAASGTTPATRYIIEDMGRTIIPNPLTIGLIGDPTPPPEYRVFRITAESFGAGRARVLLQSNYSTP